MTTSADGAGVEVRDASDGEAWEIFDQAARHYLEMSGEEFLRRHDAGEYDGDAFEEPFVSYIVGLACFARGSSC